MRNQRTFRQLMWLAIYVSTLEAVRRHSDVIPMTSRRLACRCLLKADAPAVALVSPTRHYVTYDVTDSVYVR